MRRRERHINSTSPPKTFVLWRFSHVFICLILLSLSACNPLPSAGPGAGSFSRQSQEHIGTSTDGEDSLPFVLVDVDRKILEALKDQEDTSLFKGEFTDRSAPVDMVIGAGDTIRVTIFEAAAGGLFVPTGGAMNSGNYVSMPDQEVDQRGTITMPYADKDGDGGIINVSGRTPLEVQNDIQQRLMNRAIEPQVIVTLVKRTSNLYSIIGDVSQPGRFALANGGMRILDAITVAGGPKGSDYNTIVTLQRSGATASARLSTLMTHPENNIFVQPQDVIALKKEERYYNVMGATKTNSRIPFDADKLTVADAVAKAGGLNSEIAEAATVVVLRREDPKTLETMGVKIENFTEAEPIPAVYRFNFTSPSGLFLAQKMDLRNDDVIYVSNHPFTDATKLFGVFRDVLLVKLIND